MGMAGFFTLKLLNVERQDAGDDHVRVQFLRTDGTTVLAVRDLQFPPNHRFTVPAFPRERNLQCAITPSLYDYLNSGFFTLTDKEEKEVTGIGIRLPDAWSPKFTTWDSLAAARFSPLTTILGISSVKLKHGPDLGRLTDAAYDALTGDPATLAKMCLLNLFSVLSDTNDPTTARAWFSFVKQMKVLDQERFVAIVDDALWDVVRTIHDTPSKFAGFFPADSGLHLDNIPSEYQLAAPMLSVKVIYEQGNVQFTVARVKNAGGNQLTLLDCDMDEHSNVLLHIFDFFTHQVTGGTHPVEIHEYIVNHCLNAGQTIDLGYSLVPKGRAPVQLR